MSLRYYFLLTLFTSWTNFGQAQLLQSNDASVTEVAKMDVTAAASKESVIEHQIYKVEKLTISSPVQPQVSMKNVQYKAVLLEDTKIVLPKSLTVKTFVSIERKKAIAYAFVPQYIQDANGRVRKIVSYELDINQTNQDLRKTTGNRIYASNSVLSSGSWHKIAISGRGLYKLDYNFLKDNLGLNMSSLNPSQIRLFGNGGEMLAEDNNIIPHDDLVENHIQIVGGGDGKFDTGDYILFYANGSHSIVADSANKKFTHTFNIYSEKSYYFISIGGNGQRVQGQAAVGSANQTVTTSNFFRFIEEDVTNIGRVGKTWWSDVYGDLPGKSLSKSFNFSVPNIDVSEPVTITSRVGGLAFAGTNIMQITANGQLANNISLSAIGGGFNDPFINEETVSNDLTLSGSSVNINTVFTPANNIATGYLDYIRLNGRVSLNYYSGMHFMDWNSVGPGNVAEYQLTNATANTTVWDVTNPLEPIKMQTNLQGSTLTFAQVADELRYFVAFDGSSFPVPEYVGTISNQNLHGQGLVDYIVIAYPDFLGQAQELAAYHAQKRGYKTLVVTPQQIYNEFSSGSQDVAAIRNFIKMFYDKATTSTDAPHSVLFFGDASFDYKDRVGSNTNFVPSYQTFETIDKRTSYCTDDFFGFLDDQENPNLYSSGVFVNTLDIGVGRIPSSNSEEANNAVAKIKNYDSPNSFGSWKNNMVFNADDEDGNIHLSDAEIMSQYVTDSLPQYNNYKIYVDAFQQNSTPAGPRTPEANRAIKERLFNGTFVVNYNGHGGPLGWCEERILNLEDIQGLDNKDKLPIFITATCDFTQFDNPDQKSAGEVLFANPNGGAIALMTTTRLVYQYQNRQMNLNYFNTGFDEKNNGSMPTLGDAYRLSKNLRYVNSITEWDAANFRKFSLIGDPGLPLAFPEHEVHTDSVLDVNGNLVTDTLKALGKYTISGRVTDKNGQLLSGFNGKVFPSIFDKPKSLTTLGNDAGSTPRSFLVQNNIIYKGSATVENGLFQFTFVVPKDINYNVAKGKISYYANTLTEDATGFDKNVFIGGSSSSALTDNDGPQIDPFMNDEKFVNGGITTATSTLLVKLFDENGINYSGSSVGHDITAVLDNNAQNTYILNDFYETELDDYQRGIVRFPLEDLSEGKHSLRIKAWDVLNNSSEATLDFVVVNTAEGKLARVYNYPNPFSTSTRFMFEHNMPNQNIDVSIKVFSMTGKAVKRFRETINTPGTRYDGILWDGMDEYGEKLGNGVYLYKLSIKSENGFSDDKIQKLIILR